MRRGVLVGGAIVAAGVLAATPVLQAHGEGVLGENEGQVTVPAIEMASAAVEVVTAPGGSDLSGTGGIDLQVRPRLVRLSAQEPWEDDDLAPVWESGVEYGWGDGDCDDVQWRVDGDALGEDGEGEPAAEGDAAAALPAGESRRVCVRLSAASDDDELIQRHAGRQGLAATSWEITTPAPATWNATAGTNALLGVPLPPATAAPEQACGDRPRGVRVRWAWPSEDSTPIANAEGIARWTVNVRPAAGGAWTHLSEVSGGASARSVDLTAAAVRARGLAAGEVDVMIRAYPHDGDDELHVDSEVTWGIDVPAEGPARCTATGENEGPLLHTGDRS